jgi:hypothetical protein
LVPIPALTEKEELRLRVLKFLPHYLRKRFRKKFVILESDDWGLERAIEEESIEWARRKYGEENFTRWTLDGLETKKDLELLYQVLRSYKDDTGGFPVITANFITHNIDYSSKETLSFISLSKGFNSSENVHESYRKGIEEGLMYPQLHGYSHYNISELNEYFKSEVSREAFNNKFLTCRSTIRGNLAFLQGELSERNDESSLIKNAADEFEKSFGFRSKTMIPPTFILDKTLIDDLKISGVCLVQSSNRVTESNKHRYNFPFFRKNKGLVWSVRNARLDPCKGYDFYHEQCIDSINKAFANELPAIIDFHRVNFSGRFNPAYRDRTLAELDSLIKKILLKWPDVNFIHSQKLFELFWQQKTS